MHFFTGINAFKGYKEVQQKENGLMSNEDAKEDLKMLMAPHANWEKHLLPAPLSVKVLGELRQRACFYSATHKKTNNFHSNFT